MRLASDVPALWLMLWYALGGGMRAGRGVSLDLGRWKAASADARAAATELALRVAEGIGGAGVAPRRPDAYRVRVAPSPSADLPPWDGFLETLDRDPQWIELLATAAGLGAGPDPTPDVMWEESIG
jgi:hypothetical protein